MCRKSKVKIDIFEILLISSYLQYIYDENIRYNNRELTMVASHKGVIISMRVFSSPGRAFIAQISPSIVLQSVMINT